MSESGQLKRSLGFTGVMGQSVSGVAPTATPTVNVALVFAAAGSASWFAYSLALVAILLVAANLIPMARLFSGAGSLSDLVGHGLGRSAQLVTAWALLLAYLAVSVATLAGSAGYLATVFAWAGWSMPVVVWALIGGCLAAVLAMRDIRVSTRLMLGLEVFSICLVVLLGLVILVRQGVGVDMAQFRLEGMTLSGMNNALLIGILSFVGFEAVATLGDEAKNPLRTIPKALLMTPLLTGFFFIFAAYVIVLGFNRYGIAVAQSSAPLDDLAKALHLPGLGLLVSVGAAISLFAGGLATMVAASRILFSLATRNEVPSALAAVQGKHALPRRAIFMVVAIIVPTLGAFCAMVDPLKIYDWLGTFGTLGCLLAYGLMCVAGPVYLRRAGRLRWFHVGLSLLALLVLGWVIFGSVFPVPPAPENILPWLFVGLLAFGVALSLFCRRSINRAGGA